MFVQTEIINATCSSDAEITQLGQLCSKRIIMAQFDSCLLHVPGQPTSDGSPIKDLEKAKEALFLPLFCSVRRM